MGKNKWMEGKNFIPSRKINFVESKGSGYPNLHNECVYVAKNPM
jgi:hypothetical protein